VPDERLSLIIKLCDPALSDDERVALTLHMVFGLTIEEIGRAFLVSTMMAARRLLRATAQFSAPGLSCLGTSASASLRLA